MKNEPLARAKALDLEEEEPKTTKGPEIHLPPMYPKQAEALYSGARFAVIEGSTKSGKTAGCLLWQLGEVLTRRPRGVHWWIGPIYKQAEIAFNRARADFEPLIASVNETKLELVFKLNGARWIFRSGENPDGLFGEDVESGVIDEASRQKEKVWTGLRSTLTATRGSARIITNVEGRGNWVYQLAREAEAGKPGYSYAKLTAQDALDGGILDPREIEQARNDLSPEIFRELYFCEPADNRYNPFGFDNLARARKPIDNPGPPVVFGLDLARSVDYTVLLGLDATGAVVSFNRLQAGSWSQILEVCQSIARDRPVLADATGVGDPIVEQLADRGVNVSPFVFTASSKRDLLDRLRIAFADGLIRHDEPILGYELEIFETKRVNGRVIMSAPDGRHDDAVMALALAVQHGQTLGLIGPAASADAPDALVPRSVIDAAARNTIPPADAPARAGLTVGAVSALVVVKGGTVQHVEEWTGLDPATVAAAAGSICDALAVDVVRYDEGGIGAAVAGAWRSSAHLTGVNMSLPPARGLYLWDDALSRETADRFMTAGAAIAWEMRLRLSLEANDPRALSLPIEDRRLQSEIEGVKIKLERSGKIALAPPKPPERGGPPTVAAALALALAVADNAAPAGGGLSLWI